MNFSEQESESLSAKVQVDHTNPRANPEKLTRAEKLHLAVQIAGVLVTLGGVLVTVVGLYFVYHQLGLNTQQLRLNTDTNRVSIRGQLYQSEAGLAAQGADDDQQSLATLWAIVPPTVRDREFAATLIKIVSEDPAARNAKTAEELYHSMFDAAVFDSLERSKATHQLRRLFLHTQTIFYHIHNAHDYWRDGILVDQEWLTWKNYIREMNTHPMLITVIWQGYRNRYFSRAFGRFLQQELCAESIPFGEVDPEGYERGKEFIRFFYPDMLKKEWIDALPDY